MPVLLSIHHIQEKSGAFIFECMFITNGLIFKHIFQCDIAE